MLGSLGLAKESKYYLGAGYVNGEMYMTKIIDGAYKRGIPIGLELRSRFKLSNNTTFTPYFSYPLFPGTPTSGSKRSYMTVLLPLSWQLKKFSKGFWDFYLGPGAFWSILENSGAKRTSMAWAVGLGLGLHYNRWRMSLEVIGTQVVSEARAGHLVLSLGYGLGR